MKGISLKNMEPLTAEERAFSADMKNYNQLFKYMKINRLDQEEWYDILILHYLRAVRKYLSLPHLQQYEFGAVLFRTLDSARSNYCKSMTTQKRMPDGGLVSLDYSMEDEEGKKHQTEAWLADCRASVERQVIFRELFREFYQKCTTYEDDFYDEGAVNEYLKCELDLLLEGYSQYQTWRRTEKQYPYGYTLYNLERDMEGFRRVFKEVFGF